MHYKCIIPADSLFYKMEVNVESVDAPLRESPPRHRDHPSVHAAQRLMLTTERASRNAEHPERRAANPAYGVPNPKAASHLFYDILPNGTRYWNFADAAVVRGTESQFRLIARSPPSAKRGRLPSLKLTRAPIALHLRDSQQDETITVRIVANETRSGPKPSRKASLRVVGATETDHARLLGLVPPHR